MLPATTWYFRTLASAFTSLPREANRAGSSALKAASVGAKMVKVPRRRSNVHDK